MNDLESILFLIALAGVFLTMIFYIIFGQVTVHKLRKNPETKSQLGAEFVSGWDIINVAKALSIPRSWSRKLENGPFSALHANSELLYKHTNRVDCALGDIFYFLLMLSGLLLITLAVSHEFGFFV